MRLALPKFPEATNIVRCDEGSDLTIFPKNNHADAEMLDESCFRSLLALPEESASYRVRAKPQKSRQLASQKKIRDET